ncbi:hypothetical protein R69776_04671 [Paraburkholderia nemoris]|jgi:hypothetical protein|uniref:Uncharacterized protein n=1 Tax=Paraburkholderia nemoris TaxID=2793076 RepID=A0ABN7M7H9_9BURK|nr:hypothetical protein R69776_04671 [Paraburkholderia nemoris]CAE6844572.1 hypothetical protein LMG22931_07411 [Paraburkholderia nemoris]
MSPAGLILASQPFRLDKEVWVCVALSNVIQSLIAFLLIVVFALPKPISGQAILLSPIPCDSFGIHAMEGIRAITEARIIALALAGIALRTLGL